MADDRRKYPATLTRLQWRNVWVDIQQATPGNRTHEDWLRAANRELLDIAEAKVGIGKLQLLEMKSPDEAATLRLSYDAVCGCKLSMIQAAAKAAFGKRGAVREAAYGFGKEFGRIVEKAITLEDSKDLEEDAELDGVPCEEDPAPATEPKKE